MIILDTSDIITLFIALFEWDSTWLDIEKINQRTIAKKTPLFWEKSASGSDHFVKK